jgi:hypothetical protein
VTDNDRRWADYERRFREQVVPELVRSAMFAQIVGHTAEDISIQAATELGLMLLLGKPILLVVPPGHEIPNGLRRAADEIVANWDATNPDAQRRMVRAIARIKRRFPSPSQESPPC